MGFSGISPWSLILILLIVVLLFGTKKLRNLGSDLGETLKGLKKGLNPKDDKEKEESVQKNEKLDEPSTAKKKRPASKDK